MLNQMRFGIRPSGACRDCEFRLVAPAFRASGSGFPRQAGLGTSRLATPHRLYRISSLILASWLAVVERSFFVFAFHCSTAVSFSSGFR